MCCLLLFTCIVVLIRCWCSLDSTRSTGHSCGVALLVFVRSAHLPVHECFYISASACVSVIMCGCAGVRRDLRISSSTFQARSITGVVRVRVSFRAWLFGLDLELVVWGGGGGERCRGEGVSSFLPLLHQSELSVSRETKNIRNFNSSKLSAELCTCTTWLFCVLCDSCTAPLPRELAC